jgi:hypothetical protein
MIYYKPYCFSKFKVGRRRKSKMATTVNRRWPPTYLRWPPSDSAFWKKPLWIFTVFCLFLSILEQEVEKIMLLTLFQKNLEWRALINLLHYIMHCNKNRKAMGILGFKLVSFPYYSTDFQNSKSIFILEVDYYPVYKNNYFSLKLKKLCGMVTMWMRTL